MGKKVDLSGLTFGKLTVIRDSGKRNNSKRIIYECRCSCGKVVEVDAASLRVGDTKSCGCLRDEIMIKHNAIKTKLYRIWADMLSRCRTPTCVNYKHYGQRGITVCEEWIDFRNFRDWAAANSYREGLSIDRIDVNGNYEPSNCRWATRKEQDRNKRDTRYASIGGRRVSLMDLSEETGMPMTTLRYRHDIGIRDERILAKHQRGRKFEQI